MTTEDPGFVRAPARRPGDASLTWVDRLVVLAARLLDAPRAHVVLAEDLRAALGVTAPLGEAAALGEPHDERRAGPDADPLAQLVPGRRRPRAAARHLERPAQRRAVVRADRPRRRLPRRTPGERQRSGPGRAGRARRGTPRLDRAGPHPPAAPRHPGGRRSRAGRAERRPRGRPRDRAARGRRGRHRHLRLGPRAPASCDWDDRLLELFGTDRADLRPHHRGVQRARAPRGPAAGVRDALARAPSDVCGDYAAEYRVLLPRRRASRWVTARGRALRRARGRPDAASLGAAFDTTAAAGRRGPGRPRAGGDADGVLPPRPGLALHLRQRRGRAAAAAAPRDELVGDGDLGAVPRSGRQRLRDALPRAPCESGQPADVRGLLPAAAGRLVRGAVPGRARTACRSTSSTSPRDARAEALDAGRPPQRAAGRGQRRADRHPRRREGAWRRLARLLVPGLADWCLVTLVEDAAAADWRQRLRRTSAGGTSTRACAPLVERYAAARIPALTDESFLAQALAAGPARGRPRDATRGHRPGARQRGRPATCSRGSPRRSAHGRAAARARPHGRAGSTLFRGPERGGVQRRTTSAPLREIATRAGLALDNARLYGEQRDLAEGLQRSLLTAPPEPDAPARSPCATSRPARPPRSAATGTTRSCSATAPRSLVIGDVVGPRHRRRRRDGPGAQPAARHRRAHRRRARPRCCAASTRPWRPCDVGTTATAVVARIEQTPDEVAAQRRPAALVQRRAPAAAGAHPARRPVTGARPPRSPTCCSASTPTSRAPTPSAVLRRGDVVLLYTDGLVERARRGHRRGHRAARPDPERPHRPRSGGGLRRAARPHAPRAPRGRRGAAGDPAALSATRPRPRRRSAARRHRARRPSPAPPGTLALRAPPVAVPGTSASSMRRSSTEADTRRTRTSAPSARSSSARSAASTAGSSMVTSPRRGSSSSTSTTTAANSSPTRSCRIPASTSESTARSWALATRAESRSRPGSVGSASRTQSGTGRPAQTATQTSPAYRSTRRRSGAVTWAYSEASPACCGLGGQLAVERGVARSRAAAACRPPPSRRGAGERGRACG